MSKEKKHIAILGSTGSIGTQSLEVIEAHPKQFVVEVLTANNNSELLIKQAKKHKPNVVVITNKNKYEEVNNALFDLGIKVFSGDNSLEEVVENENIDVVLTALVGYSGLRPTIRAIKSGKNIALANKETLVVAGDLITKLCKQYGVSIYPVDSEHSAIFQCLVGEHFNPIEKIYLTASGGPFRGKNREELLQMLNIEISFIEKQIGETIIKIVENRKIIEEKNKELIKLKQDYAKMIYFADKNKHSFDSWVFIFSSKSFNQAYKRLKYLKQYTQHRKIQAGIIIRIKEELKKEIADLENQKINLQKDKENKKVLIGSKKIEVKELEVQKTDKKTLITKLKKSESRFKKELHKQNFLGF